LLDRNGDFIMVTVSLDFNRDEYQQLTELAHYRDLSEFLKQIILDRVEDELDYQDAIRNLQESDGEVVSRNAILTRLNLQ